MTNLACFATSRELGDHSKNDHADDVLGGGKPFRCGLEGCGKSWKSINGLQYHLQMYTIHFMFDLMLTFFISQFESSFSTSTVLSTTPCKHWIDTGTLRNKRTAGCTTKDKENTYMSASRLLQPVQTTERFALPSCACELHAPLVSLETDKSLFDRDIPMPVTYQSNSMLCRLHWLERWLKGYYVVHQQVHNCILSGTQV
jgi:hypothetical protein